MLLGRLFLQRIVVAARAVIVGVLEELEEVESERMDECAQSRHCDVQNMSYESNGNERYPAETAVTARHYREGVERESKHAAGKAESI